MAINLVFASSCLQKIWEYGKHPINFTGTHSCSCEKIICGALKGIQQVQSLFIYCLKEQLNHARLVFSIWLKFKKSLGTFDFGDFIIIFVAESLCAFFAALMEFSK